MCPPKAMGEGGLPTKEVDQEREVVVPCTARYRYQKMGELSRTFIQEKL